jgi:DNA modification methylase
MSLPSQTQLMLPLLESLSARGGSARPREVYDELARKLNLDDEVRNQTIVCSGQEVNAFERRVRWTRQTAVLKGLISKGERSVWSLTQSANARLGNIVRGTVLTFAISEQGAFLWGSAEDALAVIEPGSVDLLMTSPPYALLKSKEYGNQPPAAWVDWMLSLCERWCSLLTPTGSMMLNIGPTWRKGEPAQELHVERLLVGLEDQLGVHLLQRIDWASPTKLPTPFPWVASKRLRVTSSIEPVLWISPNPNAYGNNRNCLRPYSERGLAEIRKPRLSKRPSGIQFGPGSFQDRGGSIPPSLITATPNGAEEAQYRRTMKSLGKAPHPAVLPAAVARFGILLATEPDDLVYDPFAGSGTVPVEAMKLGRRAIGSDRSRAYLDGAMIRAQLAGVPLQLAAA